MKHTFKVTLFLLVLFFLSQCIGLLVLSQYTNYADSDGENVSYISLPFDIERPEMDSNFSFLYLFFMIIIGTALVLVIVHLKKVMIWKFWFLLSIVMCLTIAFSAFFHQYIAIIVALIIGIMKIFRPNLLIHNISELFLYSGIGAIFVPMLSLISVSVLLILISIYDYIAVNKIKHMVTLAEFQSNSDVFAGLKLSYNDKKIYFTTPKKSELAKSKKIVRTKDGIPKPNKSAIHSAVLGGGDIAFPLLFVGVVFQKLVFQYSFFIAILLSVLLIVFVTLSLAYLLIFAKKNKYYPAMPFLTGGCFLGYGIISLLTLFL